MRLEDLGLIGNCQFSALVERSGAVVWSKTDSNFIPKANRGHGIANEAGLIPQG